MKPASFPFILYPEDQAHRSTLVSHYRKKRGRPVSFATILRELMAEAAASISQPEE